jgi:hypothetical protein
MWCKFIGLEHACMELPPINISVAFPVAKRIEWWFNNEIYRDIVALYRKHDVMV